MFVRARRGAGTLVERDPLSSGVLLDDHEPPQPLSEIATSGWLGVELDGATADPGALDDASLVGAIVGFDRMTSWAAARQAALLAEFARRRPADDAGAAKSQTARAMSPYAADEIGSALRLSYGTASIRLAQARRLDAELSGTRRAWQDGLIDATRVRAFWTPPRTSTRAGPPRCRTGSCPAPRGRPRGNCGPR